MTEQGPERVSFFTELRRRGVLRVAASYGAIAWLLIQIGGTVAEPLDLPRWAIRGLIFAALLGFPVAIGLAWFLEFTPQGVAVDRQQPGARRPTAGGLRRYADLGVIGLLLLVVGYLVARQPDVVGLHDKATVAVLPFENLSPAADGDILALGIAESVLHQLANLQQIDVISRTSSFTFRGRSEDAREIGRLLKASYLLEGSVQSDRTRLRITTQLIDARTGADVWSMRFDRRPSDIFAVQDEIAVQVTRALELTLDANAIERMKGQGTENLEAYLEYLQGRTLLAGDRVADVSQAIEHLQHAVALDPKFAAAYVGLAQAGLFVAEYDVTEDRQARFEGALDRGRTLINRALSLDPENGAAYLVRASMVAYADLTAAEADYRRGLALSPNAAQGYAGLAAVLYETSARREEALLMLDRARKLDPLQPAYDVTKAIFLLYERADVQGATDLFADVLRRNPDYQPALARLAEVRGGNLGESAEGIEYGEHALQLDPLADNTRRNLIRLYLDVGDLSAAQRLADAAPQELSLRRLPLFLYRRDWQRAGEAAYDSLARQTIGPHDSLLAVSAIRMHARATGDFERARIALETMSGTEWDPSGRPSLRDRPGIRDAEIGLADVLLAGGHEEQGRRLLAEILARIHHEIEKEGRSEYWYRKSQPVALALNGQADEAIAMLQRAMADYFACSDAWSLLESEPAYDGLRQDPRFQALLRTVRAHRAEQRLELDRRRAEGRVPTR
jgi:TolB-like protein